MIKAQGNLWTYPADVRIITTNGFVKKNGRAVMGRGCAKEALDANPNLSLTLGTLIVAFGNHVFGLSDDLISFPVKYNWWEKADLDLIEQSTNELMDILGDGEYVMPRAGCGNGKLKWADVEPILAVLPDNVTVVGLTTPPESW